MSDVDSSPTPWASTGSKDRSSLTTGGYLVAGTLAVAMFAVAVGVVIWVSEARDSTASEAASMGVNIGFIAGMFAAGVAVVVGTPLTIVVHRLLRPVRSQAVHVFAFGVVGVIVALGFFGVFGFIAWTGGAWLLVLGAGGATAMSRFVVGLRQGIGWFQANAR
jgi:hypothetical protein